jgi:hypothetical protein
MRRSGDELDICGYSYGDCLNGMRGLNFSEERKLATTTGGEPVHSDVRDGRNGNVHEADCTIATKGIQVGLPQKVLRFLIPNRSVIPTVAQRSRGTCCSPSTPIICSLMEALSSPLSSRPERSVVEGSAVQRTRPGNLFTPLVGTNRITNHQPLNISDIHPSIAGHIFNHLRFQPIPRHRFRHLLSLPK